MKIYSVIVSGGSTLDIDLLWRELIREKVSCTKKTMFGKASIAIQTCFPGLLQVVFSFTHDQRMNKMTNLDLEGFTLTEEQQEHLSAKCQDCGLIYHQNQNAIQRML